MDVLAILGSTTELPVKRGYVSLANFPNEKSKETTIHYSPHNFCGPADTYADRVRLGTDTHAVGAIGAECCVYAETEVMKIITHI